MLKSKQLVGQNEVHQHHTEDEKIGQGFPSCSGGTMVDDDDDDGDDDDDD